MTTTGVNYEKPKPVLVASTPSLGKRVWRHRSEYIYIAPAIIVMILVILYPFVYTIYLSFIDTPVNVANWRFVGLDNFRELFQHDLFGLVMTNTFYWSVGSTIFSYGLGLLAALLIHERLPLSNIFSSILIIPFVIGHVTAAYLWLWLMHGDFGVISQTLIAWGWIDRPIRFLESTSVVMSSLVLVNTWKSFPFAMIMLLAGLQAISETLYKAARVDGANSWQQFIEITMPQLMPVTLVTTMLLFIGNMNSFTIPFVMTGGGPAHHSEIIITWIYNIGIQTGRFGFASAISVILFLFLLVFSIFYVRLLAGNDEAGALE